MNIRISNVLTTFALVSAILLGFPVLALSDEGLSSSNQMLTSNGDVTSLVQMPAGTIGNCPALLASPLVVPITGQLGDIMIDDACEHVYVTNRSNNSVEVFSLTTGILDKPIAVGSKPFGLDASPDGNTLYVANSGDSSISIVDLKQGIESDKIVVPDTYGNHDTP
jgi:YVTN family beta-propeller protein